MSGDLPSAPQPQGDYVAAVYDPALGIAVSAGMTPRRDGYLVVQGRLGAELAVDDVAAAVALATGNAVRAIADVIGGTQRVHRCLRLSVFVAADAGFQEHSRVADHASRALTELLGDRGRAARSALGVASLPGGSPVEIELTVSVTPSAALDP